MLHKRGENETYICVLQIILADHADQFSYEYAGSQVVNPGKCVMGRNVCVIAVWCYRHFSRT